MKDNHYLTPLLLAILLHVIVFVFIFFAFSMPTKLEMTATKPATVVKPIVQAVAVNQKQVAQEVTRLQQQQQQRAAQRKAEQRKLYQQKLALKRQQQRAAKAQQALKAEAARLQQHRQQILKQQAALKKQKQAALRKQQEAAKQALLKKQQAEKELQAKLAAEQKARAAAARAKEVSNLVNKYHQLILSAITPNWIILNKNLSADVLINLAADGTVLNAKVVRSSGSAAFDRSAVTAIYKSSPLPVPKDPQAFAQFRQFQLTMNPQDLINNG